MTGNLEGQCIGNTEFILQQPKQSAQNLTEADIFGVRIKKSTN